MYPSRSVVDALVGVAYLYSPDRRAQGTAEGGGYLNAVKAGLASTTSRKLGLNISERVTVEIPSPWVITLAAKAWVLPWARVIGAGLVVLGARTISTTRLSAMARLSPMATDSARHQQHSHE